jgi:hypothetical protein
MLPNLYNAVMLLFLWATRVVTKRELFKGLRTLEFTKKSIID